MNNSTKSAMQLILSILLLLGFIPLTQAKEWLFEVSLNDKKIGSHTFSFNNNLLQSRADFKIKFLFLDAYRYLHQADEIWDGQCLNRLTAKTEENNDITNVEGRQQNGQFVIERNGKVQNLPACVMTFAYWNPEILNQMQLLNPQNAEYLDITVKDDGNETIEVKGQTILAHQYQLNGQYQGKDKLKITLWYDQQENWVGLKSVTPEGYQIVYKLI